MARRDLVSDYFNEPIFYGGLICTRAEAIGDMEAQGLNQRCIDRWMQGAESAPSEAVVAIGPDEYPGEILGTDRRHPRGSRGGQERKHRPLLRGAGVDGASTRHRSFLGTDGCTG